MRKRALGRALAAVAAVAALTHTPGASAGPNDEAGDAETFVPQPQTEARYAVPDEPEIVHVPTSDDPLDRADMYVELFRPLDDSKSMEGTPPSSS